MSMRNNLFVDTGIWIHAFHETNDTIHETALSIIQEPNIIMNTQVLNELSQYLLTVGDYSEENLMQFVKNMYRNYEIVKISEETFLYAAVLRNKYSLDYREGVMAASALKYNCDILYTERIEGQKTLDSLTLINPTTLEETT